MNNRTGLIGYVWLDASLSSWLDPGVGLSEVAETTSLTGKPLPLLYVI